MKIFQLVAIGALLLSGQSHAQTPIIGDLPTDYCGGGADNANSVERSENQTGESQACVLAFLPEAPSLGRKFESEALVEVDGKTVHVSRVSLHTTPGSESTNTPSLGRRDKYVFRSPDGSVTVLLDAHVVSSSCQVNTESCCGDDYEGKMTVRVSDKDGSKMAAVGISYYRGG